MQVYKTKKSSAMGGTHAGQYGIALFQHSGTPGKVGSWVEWSVLAHFTPTGEKSQNFEEHFGNFEEAQKAYLEILTRYLADTYVNAPPCKYGEVAEAFVD